ncbi:N-6 DNA methylase [uncultured Pedobacter sp.]|uniref:N-6 DNA methylase n=1 Tax=uncultured Pedobacter sp. TaxID=246139 RepID=UPI0025F5C1DC|nr:N-6 DNA methylase [uncultured Pedobacter sp.]
MTLHEAIQDLLINSDQPLTSAVIAEELNLNKAYKRKDGQQISATQVTARVNQYQNIFDLTQDGLIGLIDKDILRFKIEYYRLVNQFRDLKAGYFEYKILALVSLFVGWRNKFPINIIGYPTTTDIVVLLKDNLEFLSEDIQDELIDLVLRLGEEESRWLWESFFQFRSYPKPAINDFSRFFNDIINEFTNADSLHNGEYSSPQALSKFIGKFFSVPKEGIILDPFTGLASSLLQSYYFNFHNSPRIIANDIAFAANVLGGLNVFLSGNNNFEYLNRDFFSNSFLTELVDLIVTVPPFGVRKKKDISDLKRILPEFLEAFEWSYYGGQIDATVASILSIVSMLKKNGKAIIAVPDSILFSIKRDFLSLRTFLVHTGLLRGVISLPPAIFRPYFSVSTSILVIENNNAKQNDIFLFDSSKLTVDEFENKSAKIINAYHDHRPIENGIHLSKDEIFLKNYDLSPKRYLLEIPNDGNYIPIHDLCESIYTGTVVGKSNINREYGVPYIQVGDLADSAGINEIGNSEAEYFISDTELLARNPKYIQDKSVLIAKVGSKLKSSLYRFSENALCNPSIIVIKTDEKELLPEFLITQLQSDYVIKQIDAIRHNIGVPHFSKADFLNIQIRHLSIEEQRSFVASFYGKKLQEVKKTVDLQREDDLYNIIASLKHELKQPVSSLGMDIDTLNEFFERKVKNHEVLDWKEHTVALLPGQNSEEETHSQLINVMGRMISAIKDAQLTLSKAEEILNIGGGVFTPEKIPLKQFLNEVIKPLFANYNCTISITSDERDIMADKYQLEVLFKRLIENAIKHGFQGRPNKTDNLINIRVLGKSVNKEFNEIIVENNGKPFPAEFDIAKFQMVGHTTNRHRGTGFGGFHIKRIIESHGGELHLADKKEIGESQFKVRFKIYLP